MFKLINFMIALPLLFTPYAYAQSIFDQPSQKPNTPAGSMSPSDFKNAVTQMSQQTNNNLSQQAKQLYPKPQTDSTNTTNPADTQQPGNQPAATPSTVDNSFSVNNGAPTTPTPPAPGTTPANKQTDSYTGFGTTKSNQSSAPASSGKSGGWNINY